MADQYRKGIDIRSLSQLYHDVVPTNLRMLGEYALGRTSPITERDFTSPELDAIRDMYARKSQFNQQQREKHIRLLADDNLLKQSFKDGQQWVLRDNPDGNGKYGDKETLDEYRERIRATVASYNKNPAKTSLGYYDSPEGRPPTAQGWLGAAQQSFTNPVFNVNSTLGSFNAYDEGNKLRVEDRYNFDNKDIYNTDNMNLWDIINKGISKPGSLLDMMMIKYGPQGGLPVDFRINK